MKARRAFTLVEVLAAVAFIGILIPVAVEALSVSAHAVQTAAAKREAVELAEAKLQEILVEETWTETTQSGDFGEDRPGWAWRLERADWSRADTDMTELTLIVATRIRGRDVETRLSTLVEEAE